MVRHGDGETGSAGVSRETVPSAALWLGAAGLLPFFGLAMAMVVAPSEWHTAAEAALVGYGAVILSFMGGCRWGLAAAGLGSGPTAVNLAMSVAPALYAWAAAMLGGWIGLVLLAVGLGALLMADLALTQRGGAPTWWPQLRVPLTAGAAVSLLAGAAV